MSDTAPIVIVGSGQAGVMLARAVRKADAEVPITLVTGDDGASYYKPNLSKALADGKTPDDLVMAPADKLAEQLGMTVRAGVMAEAIEAPNKRLVLAGGESLAYSKLVLAVGADPIHLPIDGDAADDILAVNDLGDYRVFRDRLPDGGRVAIIGAGLIGCEFANDLAANGYGVNLIDMADWPLSRLLPQPMGEALAGALTELGATLHLGQGVRSVDRDGDRFAVTTAADHRIEADVVLSAIGLAPRTDLARTAGIHCERGICVDDHLQTSVADIYALGDCIEVDGAVLPYILPINHAAKALAPTLTGTPTPLHWPAMPVIVKTPACPTIVCPPRGTGGQWADIDGEGRSLEAVFTDPAGNPAGFAVMGDRTARRGELAKLMPPVKVAAGVAA